MKYVRLFGLLSLTVVAVMAFAGAASGTTLTSPQGTIYTGALKASSVGSISLHGAFTTVTCSQSTIEGKVESHGAGVTAGGKVSTLTFTECNFPVKVLKNGSTELHPINCNASGKECTATDTSSGAEITIETSIANCIFTTSNKDWATVTTTTDTHGHPIWHFNGVLSRTGHSIFCGSAGQWTGSYTMTTPSTLWVDA